MFQIKLLNSLKLFKISIAKSHGKIRTRELIDKMDEICKRNEMDMGKGAVQSKTSKNLFEDLDFIDQSRETMTKDG